MAGAASEPSLWNQVLESGWTDWQVFREFAMSIDWSERWIQVLMVVHVAVFLAVLATRRREGAQVCLLGVLCGTAFSAKWVNSWCHENWRAFSRHDYFDDQGGAFVALVLCVPCAVSALVVVVNLLRIAFHHLVVLKRAQLLAKRLEERNKNKKAE